MSSEILSTLLLEYDQKKRRAELDLEKRKAELYVRLPRLQEIETELNNFAINTAKSILKGASSSLDSLNAKVAELKIEKEKILKANKIPNNFLEPSYECFICKDTGYIQVENSASSLCSCLKQKLLDISYNKSNMSNLSKENFDTFRLEVFSDVAAPEKYKMALSPRQNMLTIKERCLEFVENFDNPGTHNLLFTGNTGLGKTFMSNCIANEKMYFIKQLQFY